MGSIEETGSYKYGKDTMGQKVIKTLYLGTVTGFQNSSFGAGNRPKTLENHKIGSKKPNSEKKPRPKSFYP